MSHPIPWREFIATHPNSTGAASHVGQRSENFVKILSDYWSPSFVPPEIKVTDTPELVAHATSGNEIHISTGLVDFVFGSSRTLLEACPEYKQLELESGFLMAISMNWILAHEFFHIARGHFDVLDECPGCEEALEYDADCCSVAAMVRLIRPYLDRNYPNRFTKWSQRKRVVLFALFWPIRRLIGSSIAQKTGSGTHPAWHLRLGYIWGKLAHMENYDEEKSAYSPQFATELDELRDLAFECEMCWCCKWHIPFSESTFFGFRNLKVYDDFLGPLTEKWERISPLVEKHQKR